MQKRQIEMESEKEWKEKAEKMEQGKKKKKRNASELNYVN